MNNDTRGGIGDNQAPDFAKLEYDRLNQDYGNLNKSLEELLNEAAGIHSIQDEDDKSVVTSLIKRIRDMKKTMDGLHEIEKQPHYRRGQGVDQFFFGMIGRLMKRNKNDQPGAGDVLGDMLTAYDTRKLAEEQERRRLAAEAAERARKAAEAEARRKAEEAEQARLAAERAKKPETQAVKEEIATQTETQASAAIVDHAVAEQQAEAAYVETLAKPADIMRKRGEDGTLSTMATVPFAEIIDQSKLDKDALWPFIRLDAKETALNAWAKATGHSQQMEGAKIGRRPKSVVR